MILSAITILSILPAFAVVILNSKRFVLTDVKWLAALVTYTAISEAITTLLNKTGTNTSIFIGIHGCIEMSLIALYFSAPVRFEKWRTLYIALVLFTSAYIGYQLYHAPSTFPGRARALQCIAIIAICLYHAIKWILDGRFVLYEIFVILSLFTYYCFSTAIFLSAEFSGFIYSEIFWALHDLVGIAANLLIFFALINYLKHYAPRRYHN